MAGVDVQIKTTVDSKDSVKGLVDLEKGVKKTSVTVKGLQDKLDGLKAKAEGLDVTSKEFKKLQGEIVKTDSALKNANKSLEGLDTEGKAGELGKLAGGLGAVGTAAALAFGDNKDAEAFFKTFATGLAITNAAKGAVESFTAAQKLLRAGIIADTAAQVKNVAVKVGSAVATAAMTAATTIATAAQWLWNAAITANPIGIVVVAIAAFVAGIIALGVWIYKNIETVKEWSKYLLLLLGPLGYIALAYIEMQAAEQKQADQLRENAKKERSIRDQKIKDIERQRAVEKEAFDERQTAYELEIDTLEAAGESSYEVRLAMLEDILAEKQAVLDAQNEKLQAQIDYYTNLAALQGLSTDEFKAQLLKQGVDLDTLHAKVLKNQQDEKDAIQFAQNDITRIKREHNEQQTKDHKTESDKRTAEEKKAAKDNLDNLRNALAAEVAEFKKFRESQEGYSFGRSISGFDEETAQLLKSWSDESAKLLMAQEGRFVALTDSENNYYERRKDFIDKRKADTLKKLIENNRQMWAAEKEGDDKRLALLKAQKFEYIKISEEDDKELEDLETQHQEELKAIEQDAFAERQAEREFQMEQELRGNEDNAQAQRDAAGQRFAIDFNALQNEEITKDEFRRREIELEQAHADALVAIDEDARLRQQEIRMKNGQMASAAFDALGQLTSAFNTQNEEDAKKQFKITKAFNLAAAVTNTALAVTGALTAGGNPVKLATGAQFVEAGIAATIGAANIVKIASTQFQGTATATTNTAGPNVNNPSSIDTSGPITNFTGTAGDTGGTAGNSAGLNQTPTIVRAFVTETDITNAQGNINNIEDFAGFGPG